MRFGLHFILSLMLLLAGPVAAQAEFASAPECAGHSESALHAMHDMADQPPHTMPTKGNSLSKCCMASNLATLPEGLAASGGPSTRVSYNATAISFDPHAPRLISPPPKSSL